MARTPDAIGQTGVLQGNFASTTPTAYQRAAGSPAALTTLASIDRRATAAKTRIIDHFKKFEDRWTAKEAIGIWNHHLAMNAKHPAPPGVTQGDSSAEIMKMAARNVQARANRRLLKVNSIKTRMENAVIRNLNRPDLTQSFRRAAPSQTDAPAHRQRMKP